MGDNGMPSPSPSPRSRTMMQASVERPLAGAVVCCTSVAPELRTTYAEFVTQMGAEHKLDLTSDVTHLLVGDTDTPKYKYVAKEREDVKVLKPEWVDAVRRQWMEAKHIDLDALHLEYRMPTLAGTKICITGFDDLPFRARLQKNVLENGGEYTGDLTKDVTHLIAMAPEGKKYEYGMQWQKKVVTLQWYKDTLDRGMQLEESTYHPTTPQDQQGIGSWNRSNRSLSHLGKRARTEQQGPEPAKKLRRIASARLNSQTDHMWSDLTNSNGDTIHQSDSRSAVKSAKSMPDLRDSLTDRDATSGTVKDHSTSTNKIFTGRYFVILGFPPDRQGILKDVVRNHGGTLLETIAQLRGLPDACTDLKILLVPYQTPVEQLPTQDATEVQFKVASELWVEHCMFCKLFALPDDYPLGQFLPRIKPPGFSKLIITSTGFSGIVPNHIAKIVRLLGARYEQTFTTNTSILVCNRKNQNQAKLAMAKSWSIPALAESWIWACMKENRRASFEAHALYLPKTPPAIAVPQNRATDEMSKEPTRRTSSSGAASPRCADRLTMAEANVAITGTITQPPLKNAAVERPGSDFMVHNDTKSSRSALHKSPAASVAIDKPQGQVNNTHALQAISHNSSPKRPAQPAAKPKKRLFQTFDGPSSDVENQSLLITEPQDLASAKARRPSGVMDAQSLNSDIQELLNMKTKLKEKMDKPTSAEENPKKKLMGRALSNLSNSSSHSHVRQSRASSVDSVNTDGVGSEIRPTASINSRSGEKVESNHALVGRARSKMQEGQSISAIASAAAAYDSEVQQWSEEAPAPALTQLVYEDPEEAIQLRENLAAKRRQRSRLGQREADPKPPSRKGEEAKRIRDDDLLVGAGWGGGRRTRQKDNSARVVGF